MALGLRSDGNHLQHPRDNSVAAAIIWPLARLHLKGIVGLYGHLVRMHRAVHDRGRRFQGSQTRLTALGDCSRFIDLFDQFFVANATFGELFP